MLPGLLGKPLVTRELAEHEILISVALIFFDQKVIGCCDWVVLVHLHLLAQPVYAVDFAD